MADSHTVDLKVPFPSVREAEIARNTLSVDQEPKRGGAKKDLIVKGNTLEVHITAPEVKVLRVCLNSFLDHLSLVVDTIDQFDLPGKVDSKGDNS